MPAGADGSSSAGVASAHNDLVKSRRQKTEFRTLVRAALDQIRLLMNRETLHVLLAMPGSLAVEAGRVRIPKGDMPWIIYDQVDSARCVRCGFDAPGERAITMVENTAVNSLLQLIPSDCLGINI